MKANAPEKIYIDDFGSELSHDWHTEHCCESDIEYIRADVFIDRAEEEWRNYNEFVADAIAEEEEEVIEDMIEADNDY